MRILAGGQVNEDIDSYTRVHECCRSSVQRIAEQMLTQKDLGNLWQYKDYLKIIINHEQK